MNKDKQIDEMAKVIQNTWLPINHGMVTVGDRRIREDDDNRVASDLYNAGYREAIVVVRDIFNDLNEMWHKGRGFINYSDLVRLERLHEQKYTEKGK